MIYTFSHVLLTYNVGYHAGKPIESVVYCFIISHNIGSAGELAWFLTVHLILILNYNVNSEKILQATTQKPWNSGGINPFAP